VEWADPMFGEYDRVYMSKVFTFTEDNKDIWHCEVIKGGTGYDIASKLPDEVDAMQPDYSLYGIEDVSYGFLTRGCVNKCPWCIVPKKEGAVSVYRDIDEVANGRKNVILMDNNILASEYGLGESEEKARSQPLNPTLELYVRCCFECDFGQLYLARLRLRREVGKALKLDKIVELCKKLSCRWGRLSGE
jgi:hypothetical protein